MCGAPVMEAVLKSLSRRDLARIAVATTLGALSGGASMSTPAMAAEPLGASTKTKVRLAAKLRLTASNIVDLTHTLSKDFPIIPVPGITFPFAQEPIATLAKNGVFANKWIMFDHMGTHIDATNHFDPDGYSLEAVPIESLVAPLVVIDVRERTKKDADTLVTIDDIRRWEKRHGRIPAGALVCMLSGWADKVGDPHAFLNMDTGQTMHFPGIPVPTIEFLLLERAISGVGVDTISFDPGYDKEYKSHKALFKGGKWGIENIANLDSVPPAGARVFIGPSKVAGASGGPARLLALW